MNKELQKKKKKSSKMWKQGQVTQGNTETLSVQQQSQESQSPAGVESGEGYVGQQENLLQVYQQEKENWGKYGPAAE